jgi:hypothetical protein
MRGTNAGYLPLATSPLRRQWFKSEVGRSNTASFYFGSYLSHFSANLFTDRILAGIICTFSSYLR